MTKRGERDTEATDALKVLLRGLPVAERRLDLAGFSTPVLEGGEGPPLVLLHGQGGFAAVWAGVMAALLPTHRVVAPDLPGLGRSQVRDGTLDAPGVNAWLGELIAKTCDAPPVLVAHSLGGSIAVRFALEHAEQVARVVLIDSGSLGRFRPRPTPMLAVLRFLRRPSAASARGMQERLFVDAEGMRARMGDRFAALEAYQIDRASDGAVAAANRRLLRAIGVRRVATPDLRRIRVPVALIWGREDPIMRFSIAERVSAETGWPLYPIEECGHIPMADRPDAFGAALGAALGAQA